MTISQPWTMITYTILVGYIRQHRAATAPSYVQQRPILVNHLHNCAWIWTGLTKQHVTNGVNDFQSITYSNSFVTFHIPQWQRNCWRCYAIRSWSFHMQFDRCFHNLLCSTNALMYNVQSLYEFIVHLKTTALLSQRTDSSLGKLETSFEERSNTYKSMTRVQSFRSNLMPAVCISRKKTF